MAMAIQEFSGSVSNAGLKENEHEESEHDEEFQLDKGSDGEDQHQSRPSHGVGFPELVAARMEAAEAAASILDCELEPNDGTATYARVVKVPAGRAI